MQAQKHALLHVPHQAKGGSNQCFLSQRSSSSCPRISVEAPSITNSGKKTRLVAPGTRADGVNKPSAPQSCAARPSAWLMASQPISFASRQSSETSELNISQGSAPIPLGDTRSTTFCNDNRIAT